MPAPEVVAIDGLWEHPMPGQLVFELAPARPPAPPRRLPGLPSPDWTARAVAGGVCLAFSDPAAGIARWYGLHLQDRLEDAGVDVICQWGRDGTRTRQPRRQAYPCPDLPAALDAVQTLLAVRARRGYRPSP